ncbi:AEC family transporter [Bacterioplanoides sp. SCSIO 12839]|uniref:AEC family transporter n=1 Tax=Bacterioplanoides sp. SCSIO 12839 TaxID=2829569 RepID=UPI002105BA08|nr:AEC family transporter [Bacterioplanoides sp. SCSIO 12839]UTW49760.1 AEC family transporter [Bacterioplanoides sp. SCSIO 12839]
MLYEIFAVMAPVLACAAIGFYWAKSGYDFDPEFISRLVLNVGAPCLMLSVLSSVEVDLAAFKRTAFACVLIAALMAVLGVVIPRVRGDDVRAFLPSFLFPNVGNMGLPVCMLAFGEQGLALALVFFMVLSIAHFPAGILLAGGRDAGGFKGLLKMPILYAIVIGACLVMFNINLPQPIKNSVELIGGMTIPLMLITLGVSLQRLHVGQWQQALFYSVMRIGGGLLVGLLVVWLLGLEGVERGVVIVQAAMPVAVFNYLFAERFQREPQAVAGMVVMSTLISFATVPLILGLL